MRIAYIARFSSCFRFVLCFGLLYDLRLSSLLFLSFLFESRFFSSHFVFLVRTSISTTCNVLCARTDLAAGSGQFHTVCRHRCLSLSLARALAMYLFADVCLCVCVYVYESGLFR